MPSDAAGHLQSTYACPRCWTCVQYKYTGAISLISRCHYRRDSAEAGLLKQLFAKYATPAVDYVLEGIDAGELVQKLKLTILVTNLNLVTQLCHLLDTLLLESGHYTDPNVSFFWAPYSVT